MCLQHSKGGVLWSSGWFCGGHSLKTCCLWAWCCPPYSEVGNWVLPSSLRHVFHRRSGRRHGVSPPGETQASPSDPELCRQFVEISASKYASTSTAIVNPLRQDVKMSRQNNLSHVYFTFNCPLSSITDRLRGVFIISAHSFAIRHLRLQRVLSVSVKAFLQQELNK